MENTRFQTGLEQLSKIDGEAGQKVIESLNDICPDLAKFTIEYPFGDIYTREARSKIARDRYGVRIDGDGELYSTA